MPPVPASTAAAVKPPMQHSTLIIGGGSIGERHLRCFQSTGRTRVTACDSSPDVRRRLADNYGVAVLDDADAALIGEFDSVVICTPAHLHVPMALAALNRGLNVLIEKPLSHSLAGTDELVRARGRARRHVAIAYVFHVFPFLVGARDFLREGGLGPVRHVVVVSGQPFHRLRPGYARPYYETYYRDRQTGGGAIQDALTHPVNWVESVVGPTDSVLCDCAHQVLPRVTVEDTVNVSARNGDVLVSYTLNQFQTPNESSIQFNAERGSVRIELHRQRWGVFREGDADWTWHESPAADRDAHFIRQAGCFLDEIEGKPARLCSLEAAQQTLRFNLAALASAESGARVACADVTG